MLDITQEVTDFVRSIIGDEVSVAYSKFATTDKAAAVKATPGDPVVRLYVSGGGVFRFTYEVALRVAPRKTSDRFDAISTLRRLQTAIEHREVPNGDTSYTSHEVTQLPSLISVDENGREIYSIAAALNYYERR